MGTRMHTPRVGPLHPAASPDVGAGVPAASDTDGLRADRGLLFSRMFLRYGVRPLLVGSDLVAVGLASGLSGGFTGGEGVMAALLLAFYVSGGLYRSRLSLSTLDDLPALAGRAIVAGAVATSVAAVLRAKPSNDLLVTAAVTAVAVPLLRACCYGVVRWVRARRVIAHPTIILGAGEVGAPCGRWGCP